MSYKTCERGATILDPYKSKEYCKRIGKPLDTLVQPHVPNTPSERFFSEEWINVCDNKTCDLYDNMKSKEYCYPKYRIDKDTGKIASELTEGEIFTICKKKIIRTINLPSDIILNIDLAKDLLKNGYTRVKYANKEDFSITEKNLTSETLYLWRLWMEKHGPKSIRKNGNYYLNYTKWINSDFKNKHNYSGATEWLLKGGDHAYLWLQSDIVTDKIQQKYH